MGNKLLLVLIGIIIFSALSFQGWLGVSGFTSPDEEVNYQAGKAFSDTNKFFITEALSEDTDGVVKPRNVQIKDGQLVPLSYLGFPLILGLVTKATSEQFMLFVTPLIATLAVFAFYFIVKRFWGRSIAWLSSILLILFPGFIFFSVKSLWHNVPFVSFLIFSLYFGLKGIESRKYYHFILSGLALGMALGIRTNEIVWVTIVTIILMYLARRQIKFNRVLFFVLGVVIIMTPILIMNNSTFGGPLSFGYTAALERSGDLNESSSFFSRAVNLIVPSTTNISYYLAHTRWYGLQLMPIYSVLVIIGVLFLFHYRKDRKKMLWLMITGMIGLWLAWYYAGTPYYGGKTTTIKPILGSSFVRYFLPFSIAIMPLAALTIKKITGYILNQKVRKIFITMIIVTVAVVSFRLVLYDEEGGLKKYYQKDIPQIKNAQTEILSQTEDGAVIIAGAKDKLFFPERMVMGYNKFEDRQAEALASLLGKYDTYYNNISSRDIGELEVIAEQNGFTLKQVGHVGQDILYKFVLIEQE